MAVTMKEVARRARVSTATVSRVFNDSNLVGEETRERVWTVAKELRYVPNPVGRSLSTRRTDAIGLLLPDLYGEFFSEVIRGADQTVQQHRYHLLISSSHNDQSEIEAALQMMHGRVDGLVIMTPHIDAQTLHANLPKSLPVVLLNCPVAGNAFDSMSIDNYSGAYGMVRHLLAHGHRRIAIIKGIERNYDAIERLRGYRAAITEAGIQAEDLIEVSGDFSEASGYKAVETILGLSPRPSAIFASNDSMAIGALSALKLAKVQVPGEIALVGFDNIPVGNYVKPTLTTVNVDISNLGVQAVTRLLHAVREKNSHTKHQVILPTTLIIRESCGCPVEERSQYSAKGGDATASNN